MRLQPSNPQTWLALGEYDLRTGQPQAALKELRAAVYLNPEAIAPEADIAENAELISIQNDYVQALRDTASGGGTARALDSEAPYAADRRPSSTRPRAAERLRPAAARGAATSICSKPKSSSSAASVRRV